jgi:hypothetical protein
LYYYYLRFILFQIVAHFALSFFCFVLFFFVFLSTFVFPAPPMPFPAPAVVLLAAALSLFTPARCDSVRIFPYEAEPMPVRSSVLATLMAGSDHRVPVSLDGSPTQVGLALVPVPVQAIPIPRTFAWISFFGTGKLSTAHLTRTFSFNGTGDSNINMTTPMTQVSFGSGTPSLSTTASVTAGTPYEICQWFSFLARNAADDGVVTWNSPMYSLALSAQGASTGKGAFLGVAVAEIAPMYMLNTFPDAATKGVPALMNMEDGNCEVGGATADLTFPKANISDMTHGVYEDFDDGTSLDSWSQKFPDVHVISLPGTGRAGDGLSYRITVTIKYNGDDLPITTATERLINDVQYQLWFAGAEDCIPAFHTAPGERNPEGVVLGKTEKQLTADVTNGPGRMAGLLTAFCTSSLAVKVTVSVELAAPTTDGGNTHNNNNNNKSKNKGKSAGTKGAIAAAVIFGCVAVVSIISLIVLRRKKAGGASGDFEYQQAA